MTEVLCARDVAVVVGDGVVVPAAVVVVVSATCTSNAESLTSTTRPTDQLVRDAHNAVHTGYPGFRTTSAGRREQRETEKGKGKKVWSPTHPHCYTGSANPNAKNAGPPRENHFVVMCRDLKGAKRPARAFLPPQGWQLLLISLTSNFIRGSSSVFLKRTRLSSPSSSSCTR